MRRAASLLALLSAVVACNGTAPGDSVPQWTLVEDLRIGGADTGSASFSGITALRFGPSGRIWLVEAQAPEIRIFRPDGTFERRIGRAGEGPGEIVATNGFAFAPGGLVWVPDHRLGRYNLFDTTGRFISTHPDLIRSYGYMWNGGVDAAGRLWDGISLRVDTTYRAALRRFRDTSLTTADTLAFPSCSDRPRRSYKLEAKNGYTIMSVPFDANEVGALDSTGTYWCSGGIRPAAVAIAIESGDTVATIAYDRPRLPVPPRARDSAIERITKQAREMGAQLPDFSQIPESRPAIIGVKVDDGGRVWLRVPDSTGTRFDLFDRSGKRLAEVVAPFVVYQYGPLAFRGDTLLGVIMDADDTPSVVRLHLVRGTTPR